MTEPSSDAWLSLDEVASRLGVTRLKVREAIAAGVLRARRDNRGFWRVTLDAAEEAAERMGSLRVEPTQLVEILFDEVEEATAALAERSADVERLTALIDRQQELMERALKVAERAEGQQAPVPAERLAALNERSQTLIDRALTELEARDADLAKVSGLLDRAIGAAAGLDAEVARQIDISQRQRAILDRVFAIAQAGLERLALSQRGGWFSRWRGSRGNPR
jgi:excisionase family DNA binding protein